MVSRPVTAERAARFAADMIEEIVLDGLADQWRQRAKVFEWCRPRPGDFMGRARKVSIEEQDRRVREMAQACRHRAEVIELERAG